MLNWPENSKHFYPVDWANAGDRLPTDYEEPLEKGVAGWVPDDSYLESNTDIW